MSFDSVLSCGPMNPASTPPNSTHEMACDFSAGGTLSAAAKRYCWPNALEDPKIASATQNSQKLPSQAAAAARSARECDTAAPNMKPWRRPHEWMSQAAGPVASAVPTIMSVTGKVARPWAGAMPAAVSAATEIRIAWLEPVSAWLTESSAMLRSGEPTASSLMAMS